MEKRKWAYAVIISLLFITALFITVVYHNENRIDSFTLNKSYFDPTIDSNSTTVSILDRPIINSLELNYTDKVVMYNFGEYTLLMTPTLFPVPDGPINLHHFGPVNLTKEKDRLGYFIPYVGLTMVDANHGSPGSLGFLPYSGRIVAPNGSMYNYNLRGDHPSRNSSLVDQLPLINIGPTYFINFANVIPSNYSLPLAAGNYTLEFTISLYHFLSIGYGYLGHLTFTEPFYSFVE